jgi:hypothetical protein
MPQQAVRGFQVAWEDEQYPAVSSESDVNQKW